MLPVRICIGRPQTLHGMSVLVGRFGRMPSPSACARIELAGEVAIKGIQHLAPIRGAAGDLIEFLLELRGESEIEQVVEILHQSIGNELADFLRVKAARVQRHVAAFLNCRNDRRVGRRSTDPALLEFPHEAGLAVTRRRLREMLPRLDRRDVEYFAGREIGQRTILVFARRRRASPW